MITKNFEEYFPLPWTVIEHKNGAFMKQNAALITGKKGYKESVELGLVEEFSVNSFPPRVAALKYAVKCANLMPEAVTLFGIVEEVLTLCATRAFDTETKHLLSHTAETVQTFKKKLEGGAEDV